MNNKEMTHKVNMKIEWFRQTEWLMTDNISDGHHTFWELYKHRIHNFMALCRSLLLWDKLNHPIVWKYMYECIRSKKHDDGSEWKWWFILQLETPEGQISYHLPDEYFDRCSFAEEKEKANKWDWHTSDDVLDRLLKL